MLLPDLLSCLVFAYPLLGGDCVAHLVCDADSSSTGSKHDQLDILQLLLAHMQSGHNGCERDTSSTLDIIVEAGDLGSVMIKDATC